MAKNQSDAAVVVPDTDGSGYVVILPGEEIPERVADSIDNPVVLGKEDAREDVAHVAAKLLAEPTVPASDEKGGPSEKQAAKTEESAAEANADPKAAQAKAAKGSDKK